MSVLMKKLNLSTTSRLKLPCYRYSSMHNPKDDKEVRVKRKITSQDVEAFSKLTCDYNPIHEKIVHGAFLNGLVSGIIGTKLPGKGSVLVSQEMHFPHPCFVGSTVDIIVSVTNIRKITICNFKCVTEDGTIVHQGHAKVILKNVAV